MNDTKLRSFRLLATSATAAAALVACGGGSSHDPADDAPATGSVTLAVQTDAPSCGLDAVTVSINRLRLHQDAGAAADAAGWVDIPVSPAKKINLLNAAGVLSGATTDVGTGALPAGIYRQVRIVLDAGASSVRTSGTSADTALETAAADGTSGWRVPLDLRVDAGQAASAVVDVDACYAIQRRDSAYVLKPNPRPVPATLNGISGFIDKAALASNVTVTAQVAGTIWASTVPHPSTGEFRLPRLQAGNYDVVILGTGRAAAVIGAVPVTAGATTSISTTAAPLALAASATSTIGGRVTYAAPAVAPDSGTWVKASQTITANTAVGNAATTVTYRFQPVDLASGAYTLAGLPRASVQFALYKTALPLVPANAATSLGTGRYRVETVATGFSAKTTTASANVNVGSANAAGIDIVLP